MDGWHFRLRDKSKTYSSLGSCRAVGEDSQLEGDSLDVLLGEIATERGRRLLRRVSASMEFSDDLASVVSARRLGTLLASEPATMT